MQTQTLHDTRATQSMHALANATELAAQIIARIMGNDVSDSINGSRLTMTAIKIQVVSRIRANLENKTK